MTTGRITLDRAEHLDLLRRAGDAEERAAVAEKNGQATAHALLDLASAADAEVTRLRELGKKSFLELREILGAGEGSHFEHLDDAAKRVMRELGRAREEIAQRKARCIELESECARCDASATAARIAKGVREAERDEARQHLAERETVLEGVERALGQHATGDLVTDVERLVAATLASIPVATVESIERVGDEEDDAA